MARPYRDRGGLGVGFEEEAGGWDEAGGVGVEAGSEGEVDAAVEELEGEGGFLSEAVDDPGLGGAGGAVDGEEEIVGAHAVDDEGLLELLADGYLAAEDVGLQREGRVTEAVEAAFADGHDAGVGAELQELIEVGLWRVGGVPRVDAHGVDACGVGDAGVRIGGDDGAGTRNVGVYVGYGCGHMC